MSNDKSLRLELQKHILPIIATLPSGRVECVGTGFVTLANGRTAHLVTAGHVIRFMRQLDNPYPRHHSSALAEFLPLTHRFELKKTRPRAMYFDGKEPHAATIEVSLDMKRFDLALCRICFDDDVPPDVTFASRLGLDTTPVTVGEPVIAIGYSAMKPEVLLTRDGWIEFRFNGVWEAPKGCVTAVYPEQGPTGQQGPHFQVDVPFKPGMSGSPVVSWDGDAPYVRGFVSKGEDRLDEGKPGQPQFALAGMIWPLMLMSVDLPQADGAHTRDRCLLDLEREGVLFDKGRAHQHVTIARDKEFRVTNAVWS